MLQQFLVGLELRCSVPPARDIQPCLLDAALQSWGHMGKRRFLSLRRAQLLRCKATLSCSKVSPTAPPISSLPRHPDGEEEAGREAGSDPRAT